MSALSPTGRLSPIHSPQAALRARIGWLCDLIRIAAVVWALWILATIAWYWSDSAAIVKGFGSFLEMDLSGVSNVQYALAVAGKLGSWALQAAVSYCIWRQFGTYLQGRIFLQALFCLAVIGFAQIYNAAADMADDHARIV